MGGQCGLLHQLIFEEVVWAMGCGCHWTPTKACGQAGSNIIVSPMNGRIPIAELGSPLSTAFATLGASGDNLLGVDRHIYWGD